MTPNANSLEDGGLTPLWPAVSSRPFANKNPLTGGEGGVKPPHSKELSLHAPAVDLSSAEFPPVQNFARFGNVPYRTGKAAASSINQTRVTSV